MYVGRHVKYPCQILMKIEFSRQIFEKSSNIKFMNSRSVGGGGFFMRTDVQTDLTEPRVAFRQHAEKLQSFSPKPSVCVLELSHNSYCRAAAVTSNINQSLRLLTVRSGRSQTQQYHRGPQLHRVYAACLRAHVI
jgi:hypothetical protein